MPDVSVASRPPCWCQHGVSIQSSINLGETFFPNNAWMKNRTDRSDLNLGEVVCLSIIYHTLDSWLYLLNERRLDTRLDFYISKDISLQILTCTCYFECKNKKEARCREIAVGRHSRVISKKWFVINGSALSLSSMEFRWPDITSREN